MNTRQKLGMFAAALLLAFGGASLVGFLVSDEIADTAQGRSAVRPVPAPTTDVPQPPAPSPVPPAASGERPVDRSESSRDTETIGLPSPLPGSTPTSSSVPRPAPQPPSEIPSPPAETPTVSPEPPPAPEPPPQPVCELVGPLGPLICWVVEALPELPS